MRASNCWPLVCVALLATLACVAAQQFAPSINSQGVWLPNPVAQIKNEIHRTKQRFSLKNQLARTKQQMIQSNPITRSLYNMNRKMHNIENAIKY